MHVVDRGGEADQRHARVAPQLVRERRERQRTRAFADVAAFADQDVGVYRVFRNVAQTQRVQRFAIDVLPADVTDLDGAARDDALESAVRRILGPRQIRVGFRIPRRNVRLSQPSARASRDARW